MKSFPTLLAAIGALTATVAALNPIEVKEQEFVDSKTGDRFMLLGVDYQPGGPSAVGNGDGDPLSKPDDCLRDAALMQNLGINAIRVYNIDPTLNHDECASIFDTVGIYMLLDVNSPLEGQYINRDDPASTYNTEYLTHVFTVIEAFKNYPNLLGFFSGNEVINDEQNAGTVPPYIRAIQRDMKNYIKNNADRPIPVGYSAADITTDLLQDMWAYFQCEIDGTDDPSRSDFFGLNDYEWCGAHSSYTISGYNILAQMFSKSTVPVFFSEYGCNKPLPRLFDEVPVLYGPQMSALSGGMIYEWTEEPDPANFGLIQVNGDGAKILDDYNTVKEKFAGLNVQDLTHQNPSATSLVPPTCGPNVIGTAGFSTDFKLPNTPGGAVDLINNGIPNAPVGQIVDVKTTTVSAAVYQVDGSKVEGLHIVTGATKPDYPGMAKTTDGVFTNTNSNGGSGGGGDSSSSSSGSDSSGSSAVDARAFVFVAAAVALGSMVFAL